MDITLIDRRRRTIVTDAENITQLDPQWAWANASRVHLATELADGIHRPEAEAILQGLKQVFNTHAGHLYLSEINGNQQVLEHATGRKSKLSGLYDAFDRYLKKSDEIGRPACTITYDQGVLIHFHAVDYAKKLSQHVHLRDPADFRHRYLPEVSFDLTQNIAAHELLHYAYAQPNENMGNVDRLYKTSLFKEILPLDCISAKGPSLALLFGLLDALYKADRAEEIMAWSVGYALSSATPQEMPCIYPLISNLLPLELAAIQSGDTQYRRDFYQATGENWKTNPALLDGLEAVRAMGDADGMTLEKYHDHQQTIFTTFTEGFKTFARSLGTPRSMPA